MKLLQRGRGWELIVSDNGRGFNPTELPTGGHFGLKIMRERCQAIGATFVVRSQPGEGTILTVTQPDI